MHWLAASLTHWIVEPMIHWFVALLFHWFIELIHGFIESMLRRFFDSLLRSFSGAVIVSCHFTGISATICSVVDAPRNFNSALLLHRKSFPIGHWFPIVMSYLRKFRPGACRELPGKQYFRFISMSQLCTWDILHLRWNRAPHKSTSSHLRSVELLSIQSWCLVEKTIFVISQIHALSHTLGRLLDW